MDYVLAALSLDVGRFCAERKLVIATAESCTGGWAAQTITHTAGSSAWFDCGFTVYSNAAKADILGVPMNTIETHGAVSVQTAEAMALGALRRSRASLSLAITGIAGPGGGEPDKPVGTVCFGWCARNGNKLLGEPSSERRLFGGDRESIRRQSVIHALAGLLLRARNMP